MAVAYVSTTTSGTANESTSITFAVDATGGDCLVVGVALGDNAGAGKTVTGVTYNGVALTKVDNQRDTTFNASDVWLGYALAPASGSHNVVVTANGVDDFNDALGAGAILLSGVHQTVPIGTPSKTQGSGGATSSLSLGDVGVTGDLIVDVAACGTTSISKAGAAQTQRWVQNLNNGSSGGASGGSTAPAGTTTLSWNINADHWVTVAVPFKAAGASQSVIPLLISQHRRRR